VTVPHELEDSLGTGGAVFATPLQRGEYTLVSRDDECPVRRFRYRVYDRDWNRGWSVDDLVGVTAAQAPPGRACPTSTEVV
jgi:hypothetical protein